MFGSLREITGHIINTPFSMGCFDLIFMSVALVVARFGFKFKWLKSALVSAVITSFASILMGFISEGMRIFRYGDFYLYIVMPFLPLAVIMIIRDIGPFFRNMECGTDINPEERKHTLDMVQDGRITPEEGAELLDALGRSNAMMGQDKFSRLDAYILAGISIAVLGFFLPWSIIAYGVSQSGQHFKAEGWAVLIIAVLAAIPVFVTPKDFLYKISMLQIFLLLLDEALVISLLLRILKIGAGLPMCLIGITLALMGCVGKFKKLTA